ncbi:sigma-70 family RNA polymerase sigma factor [Kitasatospora sp. NPDC050543]|uniref:BACON domain-containing protein n=1 Tax=Kitasatospora sp. NPDC050543 TaxID=3364054 RepID=UPI0037A70E7E
MTTSAERSHDAVLAAYDRQLDGLFTYCLSVLCEHDAAVAAVREVRELALRHGCRLAEPGLVRAWLYALARYCCLYRLERGPGIAGPPPGPLLAAQRRRELASLAWPEAAGTDPEQREALELSVRHRLSPIEVAAVLGVPGDTVRALLASAGAEVGRTRAALLVLGVGSCPELNRLGGAGAESWREWVLGPALRRELVQHVVECPTCRGTAERVAGEVAEGLAGMPGLCVLTAPVPARVGTPRAEGPPPTRPSAGAAFLSGAAAGRRAARQPASAAGEEPGLRFDPRGFPRHRAPGPTRSVAVRQRVLTTGVLAAVLAAPVVALWAGHGGGDGPGSAATVSSVRVDSAGQPEAGPGGGPQEPAGAAATGRPAPTAGGGRPFVPAAAGNGHVGPQVAGLELAGVPGGETLFPRIQGPLVPVPAIGSAPLDSPRLKSEPVPATPPAGTATAPVGQLTVEAAEYGSRTVITLTNSGGTEIRWHAAVDVAWLRLSRDAGTLAPGQRLTITVTVDEERAPDRPWTARIALPPSQAVVSLEGGPQHHGGSSPAPADPGTPPGQVTPGPAPTATATAAPTATPTHTPQPTHTPAPTPTGTPSASPTAAPPSGSPTATATPTGTPPASSSPRSSGPSGPSGPSGSSATPAAPSAAGRAASPSAGPR